MDGKQLGAIIRHHRRLRGLSQRALGKKIETTAATISRIETGKQNFTRDTLLQILRALDISLVGYDIGDDIVFSAKHYAPLENMMRQAIQLPEPAARSLIAFLREVNRTPKQCR